MWSTMPKTFTNLLFTETNLDWINGKLLYIFSRRNNHMIMNFFLGKLVQKTNAKQTKWTVIYQVKFERLHISLTFLRVKMHPTHSMLDTSGIN